MQLPKNKAIHAALKRQTHIDVLHIIKECHSTVFANIPTFLGSMFLLLVGMMVLAMILMSFFGITNPFEIAPELRMQMEVLFAFVLAPLFTGLLMMGVRSANNKDIQALDIMTYLPRILVLGVTSVFLSLWVTIGMLLFLAPGLYLLITTMFVLTLIVEKGLKPTAAIYLSIRIVHTYFWQMALFHGVFFLGFVLSVFTLGLGFLYVLPCYYVTKGKLYTELFGLDDIDVIDVLEARKDDTTFEA